MIVNRPQALFFAFLIFLMSCSNPYQDGMTEFQAGRYDEALEQFNGILEGEKHYQKAQVMIAEIEDIMAKRKFMLNIENNKINLIREQQILHDKPKEEAIINLSPLGEWIDKNLIWNSSVHIHIYEEDNQLMLKMIFRKDGSINVENLNVKEENGQSKLFSNAAGEYFMVESDGRLGIYDEDGLISKADRVR